jgi:hypothetical protein
MLTPEEIFDVVEHVRVFSTLDLCAGYHQLPVREEDKAKTAFWVSTLTTRIVCISGSSYPLG